MQVFAREVIEKVGELEQEKKKTEKAFHDFLHSSIVKNIKKKKVLLIKLSSMCKISPFSRCQLKSFNA